MGAKPRSPWQVTMLGISRDLLQSGSANSPRAPGRAKAYLLASVLTFIMQLACERICAGVGASRTVAVLGGRAP